MVWCIIKWKPHWPLHDRLIRFGLCVMLRTIKYLFKKNFGSQFKLVRNFQLYSFSKQNQNCIEIHSTNLIYTEILKQPNLFDEPKYSELAFQLDYVTCNRIEPESFFFFFFCVFVAPLLGVLIIIETTCLLMVLES